MLFDTPIAFVAAYSLALGLGCVTVEPIHRPPTPAEIDQINAAQAPVEVELLPRAGPSRTIDRVVSADVAKIVVGPEDGATYSLRLDDVSRFYVRRGRRGAAIGAGVGAGLATVVIADGWLIGHMGDPAPPGGSQTPCSGCGSLWRPQALAGVTLVSMAVGALIGATIGSRHFFPLDLGPPPPAPPLLREAPAGKRSARVVAPSTKVHSAPFNVAPVIDVLVQGQGLFVDATATAGWRVATLLDSRVGYIEDAQVKVESP